MVTTGTLRLALVALVLSVAGSAFGSLSIGDANFLGIIDPSEPADAENQVDLINFLRAVLPGDTGTAPGGPPGPPGPRDLDRTLSSLAGPFTEAVEVGAFRLNRPENGPTSVFLPSPFQYVAGKYGTSLAVWYFAGGIAGEIVMPASAPGGGLSHTSAYNVVPEVSSLLVWSGLGLTGLCFFRRRRGQ